MNSKINIFEEMRYFLMFYLNLGFIVHWALVLLILSNFSFLSIGHSFSRTFILLLCNFFSKIALHVFLNFICNIFLSLICMGLRMKFVWTSNKLYMHSCQKWRIKVLEKLCPINRKLRLDKIESNNAQCTMNLDKN